MDDTKTNEELTGNDNNTEVEESELEINNEEETAINFNDNANFENDEGDSECGSYSN